MKTSREQRARLTEIMGGKCIGCGTTEHLQFDCIVSTGTKHHRLNSRDRILYYYDQHSKGNLQLLCPKCHTQKTLDEIAARRFHEFRLVCPNCGTSLRVSDQMRNRKRPVVAGNRGVAAADSNGQKCV